MKQKTFRSEMRPCKIKTASSRSEIKITGTSDLKLKSLDLISKPPDLKSTLIFFILTRSRHFLLLNFTLLNFCILSVTIFGPDLKIMKWNNGRRVSKFKRYEK
ncbi:uncharacterized protein LOC131646156 isoform X2 [Vicia villosa]|uniref:uncharacterized protein LOC131646156 isoform X2 n=1 Tax=Vicia villosa TaxID=3911 RepID=UPI00273BC01F|nr:uncharacterized protein LOC131646156 isoform X2 [Vicia villosa]